MQFADASPFRARWLVLLVAALTARQLAGCAGVTTMPAMHGLGAQDRVGAFNLAAPTLAPVDSARSACVRLSSSVSGPGIVAGFCVAAESEAAGLSGVPRAGSALKTDAQHSFPDIVDNSATEGSQFSIPTKGPGGVVVGQSDLYQVEGSLNGKQGVFEWIEDGGNITHRRFIPGGSVTGYPNQVP